MAKQDVFTIDVNGLTFSVETKYQDWDDATIADYCLTAEGYDFAISPGKDEENPKWVLVRGEAAADLVQSAGEAIEDHYV